jgi:hypothetical protein
VLSLRYPDGPGVALAITFGSAITPLASGLSAEILSDKNLLRDGLNIPKWEWYFKKNRPQDMKEGFRPVSQITITK